MTLTVAEEFTGIGGFTLGFHRAGMQSTFMGELLTNRCALLAQQFPGIPIGGDINATPASALGRPDVLCGGFPCDGTSIAQVRRVGLADHRSGEFFDFMRLVREYQRLIDELAPRWVVLENPDGLLRSPGRCSKAGPCEVGTCTPASPCRTDRTGHDLAVVLDHLVRRGYGVRGRVLDAQAFGSAQRRRRLILVAHRGGDPRPAGQVLDLVRASLATTASSALRRGPRSGPHPVPVGGGSGTGHDVLIWRKSANPRASLARGGYETWVPAEHSNTLTGYDWGTPLRQKHFIQQGGRLRTLTILEWERLAGFPDGWTESLGSDSDRADALGDSAHSAMTEALGRALITVDAALPALHLARS